MKQLYYFLFLFLILFQISCIFNQDDCWKTYQFEIPFSIHPLKDTVQIGDTLWLTSEILNNLEDLNSSEMIEVADFDFQIETAFSFIEDPSKFAENDFDFINQKGEIIVNQNGSLIRTGIAYETQGNSKTLRIGIIPKIASGFYFTFYSLNSNLENVTLTKSDCIENIELNYSMNNGINNHYYLIENSPADFGQLTLDNWKREGGYAFWVTE